MINRERLILLLCDIRFWIGLFVCLHLTSITLPPLEPGSAWRQTDGYMIARNFYERNVNFFYPTVDVGGTRPGIVGCEFPIISYKSLEGFEAVTDSVSQRTDLPKVYNSDSFTIYRLAGT
ncbi:MAG TPA: hypothetical protein VF473_01275 [Cyclobacteriaceae bacterium]